MGDIKWWHAWKDSPSPPLPCACQCWATGMTCCTGTWETQLTLLPWQPSQRITVLQHTTSPTTLTASAKWCSFRLCAVMVSCCGLYDQGYDQCYYLVQLQKGQQNTMLNAIYTNDIIPKILANHCCDPPVDHYRGICFVSRHMSN